MPTYVNQKYIFKLDENPQFGWNPRLTSEEFSSILSNLTAIKIKASYAPHGAGFLDSVVLESGQRSELGQSATWIEMCTCAEGYVGQFCESCAPGFRHDPPNGGKFARCIPCNCNGHADLCDVETGRCICQDNTTGDNCERCARGYYGNALLGNESDCQPCPCPSQGPCVILIDETVACLECPTGYAGHRCDLCTDGYFGDPRGDHGPKTDCQKCACNGNVDLNAIGNCDRITGECLKCIYNTTGAACDVCLAGFYGDANKRDCKACDCHHSGTDSDENDKRICESITGQCSCKPNVRGRQCDRCEIGFWNLLSGEGCKECGCDPLGSHNSTCDVLIGQCLCKEGVIGKQCDQCVINHYGYSDSGCKSCDCDLVGSVNLQCSDDGQCECRPNVEGRACERCKENKYGKESGCVDCPACYNLVQDAVNVHRAKINELSELLESINKNPSIIDDKDFEMKLQEVMTSVDTLLEDAKQARGSDGNLVDALAKLKERILAVQKTAQEINEKILTANEESMNGIQNVTSAELVIGRAQDALANAKSYLETEGTDALIKAKERSEKFGQQSNRMSEIAREARQLADQQETESKEIDGVANDALNTSSEAYRLAREAIDQQARTADEINDLRRNYGNIEELMGRTKNLANNAKKEAAKAYDDALDILTKANNLVIPDLNIDDMKDKSDDISKEAKRIKKEAEDLIRTNKNMLARIETQKEEATELLEQGIAQQQVTDELLADVDRAYADATDAVKQAEEILSQAKDTLKTLKGFDELVQKSKGDADEELKKVPEIQALIEEAENKTQEAANALSGAERDAIDARDIAQKAQEIAEQASEDADKIRDEASTTKTRSEELKIESDDLEYGVQDADTRIKQFEDQAIEDEKLAKEALEKANQAKTNAVDASNKVNDALDTVNKILKALDNLDEIDTDQLDDLEKKLAQAETELEDANLDQHLTELQAAKNLQSQWIKDYTYDLEQLRNDVNNVQDIRDSLPNKCFKRIKLEP
ncbi:Laminin subunit gamma-1 [Nymphon striatum]|nr:Laminin subunit gamma-1 [Nymphon striatum]